ncbi:E3 ubiquitin-protein ligase march6 [Desmophyllum pertusum]|uniref:RING-type E3 ubiquitin transferase n=1 Tax=Desmophyllum pertusum TaxID=174260 RepID=A0A9W9ZPT1_9CNID|nr:E3 ubiquitin-protein ligase march6 [Desmophyllum pertusum]
MKKEQEEIGNAFLSNLNQLYLSVLIQVYQDGVRNINVMFIFRHVTLPVVTCLLLAVSFPYVVAAGVVPIFVRSPDTSLFCLRRIYPFLLAMFILIVGFIFQGRQFRLLYERIRNDKYLVGQKLVNYEHRKTQSQGCCCCN